jgi:hypothetical protein
MAEIQFATSDEPQELYGFDHIKTKADQRALVRKNFQEFCELFELAKVKMSAFYKCSIL